MSHYTTELRYICEYYAGKTASVDFTEIDEVIEAAIPEIFSNYPIFDESYRQALNTKIIRHFYFREIGDETVALFKFRLANKMNEIMPYYNQLYKSELLEFNPLYDVEYGITRTGVKSESSANNVTSTDNIKNTSKTIGVDSTVTENSDTGESTSTSDGNRTNTATSESDTTTAANETAAKSSFKDELKKYSDTPSGGLQGVIESSYLTNASDNEANENDTSSQHAESKAAGNTTQNEISADHNNVKQNASNNSTANGSTTSVNTKDDTIDGTNKRTATNNVNTMDDYVEKVSGKMNSGKSFAAALIEFRKSFLNIDMQIINELEKLFFGLWG